MMPEKPVVTDADAAADVDDQTLQGNGCWTRKQMLAMNEAFVNAVTKSNAAGRDDDGSGDRTTAGQRATGSHDVTRS